MNTTEKTLSTQTYTPLKWHSLVDRHPRKDSFGSPDAPSRAIARDHVDIGEPVAEENVGGDETRSARPNDADSLVSLGLRSHGSGRVRGTRSASRNPSAFYAFRRSQECGDSEDRTRTEDGVLCYVALM